MAKPIRTTKFPGMDNVQRQGFRQGEGTEEASTPTPVVLNMEVTTDQKLVKRSGFALWQALPGAHSLFWTGTEFLCAGASTVQPLGPELIANVADREFSSDTGWWVKTSATISGGVATITGAGGGVERNNALIPGRVYTATFTISNYVSGNAGISGGTTAAADRYPSANGTFTRRFVADGTAPTVFKLVSTVAGVSFDNVSVREVISPASASLESLWRVKLDKTLTEITPITGYADPLFYIPLNGCVYISSRSWTGVYENGVVRAWGSSFGDDPDLLDDSANSEEMMLLNTMPAPHMENLTLAGGRIFGNFGQRLWFNDPPMAYEMFRPDAFLDFPEPLVMIAKATDGMYFASLERTWYAAGFDPSEWKFTQVGDGAVPGSLQIVPQLGNANNVPVWVNRNGVQAAVGGGVQQVTQDKVRFDAGGRAASLYRDGKGGQYLTNFIQPADVGFGDQITGEVVRNGKLIQ